MTLSAQLLIYFQLAHLTTESVILEHLICHFTTYGRFHKNRVSSEFAHQNTFTAILARLANTRFSSMILPALAYFFTT